MTQQVVQEARRELTREELLNVRYLELKIMNAVDRIRKGRASQKDNLTLELDLRELYYLWPDHTLFRHPMIVQLFGENPFGMFVRTEEAQPHVTG